MFKDRLKADLDKLSPNEETKNAILENLKKAPPKKAKILNFMVESVIAACLAVVIALSVTINSGYFRPLENDLTNSEKTTTSSGKSNREIIFDALKENYTNQKHKTLLKETFSSSDDYSANYSSDSEGTSSNGSKSDYSRTNTREENVDEEDIVKTDGKYIYKLSDDDTVNIYKVDGAKTEQISKINFYPYIECDYEDDDDYFYDDGYACGMYLYNNKIVLVCETYDRIKPNGCNCNYCKNKNIEDFTEILIYDVKNPQKPSYVKSFKQSGYFDSSRMINDKLYISSNYYLDLYRKVKYKEKSRYLPILCEEDTQTIQNEKSMCISDDKSDLSYTVICSYDIDDFTRIDDCSVFGGSTLNYVSEKNMYFTENVYKITNRNAKYEWVSSAIAGTKITRFSIKDGKIKKEATGKISGELLNEFSLDENNGYLRLVTTQNDYKGTSYNSLIILDMNLKKVSSIEKLAKGERIYSARFMGDYTYFVTFKETDPLFCADISDPENPKIVSKLKIPGFSDYLHPFSQNKLFGFGQSATDDGEVTGYKLSMFDISDKKKITEENTKIFKGDYYSDASYNHKAILVSAEKNLIGFAIENYSYDSDYDDLFYFIYGYDENKGFLQKAKIKLNNYDEYYCDIRGLYIDDYFYICTDSKLIILDLNTFKTIKVI